jgi:hypothetical protein
MILISLNTSNFSSNVRISRELSIRSDENYVVSSMVTTTVPDRIELIKIISTRYPLISLITRKISSITIISR